MSLGPGRWRADGAVGRALAEILRPFRAAPGSAAACTRGVCRVSLGVSSPFQEGGKGKLACRAVVLFLKLILNPGFSLTDGWAVI